MLGIAIDLFMLASSRFAFLNFFFLFSIVNLFLIAIKVLL